MTSTSPDSSASKPTSAREQLGDQADKVFDTFLLALMMLMKGDSQPLVDLLTKLWTPVFELADHEGIKAIITRLRTEFTSEEDEAFDPLAEAKHLRDFVREATGSATLTSEDTFKILSMVGFHEGYIPDAPPEHPLSRLLEQLSELLLKYGQMKLAEGLAPSPSRMGTVRRPAQAQPFPRPTPVRYEEQHCLHCFTKRRDHAADGCQRFIEMDELPNVSVSPGRTAQAGAVPAVEIDVAMGIQAIALLTRSGMISPEGQVKAELWQSIQEMIAAEDAAKAAPSPES